MTKGKALNKLSKSMCVLAAIAVGMVAWAEDSALARWRMAMATNGYAAVERKVKVSQDVRQAIWKSYREHIGYEGVQMSAPRLVSTNEFGAVYDLPFTTADGAKHNFGVNVANPRNKPFYWICAESSQGGKPSDAGLESYIRDRFFSGGMGESRVSSSVGTLSDGAVVSLGFAGEEVKSPFSEYYFVFIDDCPSANWGHPARCVFVKSDLTAFAVLYVNMPARATVGGEDIEMRFWSDAKDEAKATMRARSDVSLTAAGTKGVFPETVGGDASNCYALLISGGGDERNNHGRYWNDICFAYNVLHLSYKLPRTNIKVLWANGNPNSDLCWKTGKCCWKTCLGANAFPSTSLCDFDQDGNDDITGAATAKNVSAVLNEYAASLKSTDQLFIFVTDHGNKGTGSSDKEPAVLCMWGGEISDVQFANLTKNIKCPVMVALETCYSGGMVEEFLSSGQNRIIATADGFDSSQDGNHAMDVWVYNFFSALCGYYPGGTYYLHNSDVAPVDVRSVGKSCNADYDGDGKISFFEAAQFAFDNNPIQNDIPENRTSTANLHKKLFMTQYADAPAVVVKEKVQKPTLSPTSGSLGHAPCTITATCGTAGATIRFTTDGSDPTATSAVYKGPTSISTDMMVSIRAFKSGMEASDVTRVSYVFQKTAPEKALITSVSQGDSSSGIVVCWSGGSGTESYDLLRSESSSMSSTATIVSGLAASTSSYADLTASPGKTYYYQIRSRNKYGTTLSAASQGAYLMLNPPDGVTATVTSTKIGAATVRVDWDAAAGASYYRVYRKTSDGTLTALGSWQSSRTYTDNVPLSGAITKASYYVRSSAYYSGSNPSGYSREVVVTITSSSDDWQLMLNYPWHSTTDLGAICHRPGTSREYSCRLQYADGTFEQSGFVTSPSWRVKNGQGIALTSANGSYNGWSYRPPTVSVAVSATAPEQTATITASFTTPGGVTVTRDFTLFVTTVGVPKAISVSSPGFATPGETIQLGIETSYYGYQNWDDEPWEKPEATWTVIGGSGATITEDGELTAWPVTAKTSVTVQARVNTLSGVLTAVKTLNVSPAVITKQVAVIPPLGGESTNFVGKIDTTTYCECDFDGWITGPAYHGSKTTNPADCTINISLGRGKSNVGLIGWYMFLSLKAERNPGKDRETTFKLRWDGGGIDFTVVQKEAPYAKNPVVSGGANGTITANSTTDGSVLHYATDGEEPSANSPVLSNRLDFNESTALAVKAFGEWMQASDTVYADVVGKDSQWDEVEISFSAGQAGLATPGKRMYKVNETFGELPSFPRTNGLYFKGWTLHEGSDKLVSATDSVPSQSATLYAVWSPVEEDKPQWTALPWNFKSAMSATMKVYDDTTGTYLDPSVCIIGIEDADGVCRGSSENGFGDMQSDLNGKDGLYVFGIYSQIESGKEEGLRIRIWNRQKGFMIAMPDSLSFDAASSLGSETSPHVIHVASGYKVVFNANGGTVGESERMVLEGANMGELPEPTRSGYMFNGWYSSLEGGTKMSASDMVTGDMTLYAHWTAVWTVTLNANGGELADGVADKVFVERNKNNNVGLLPTPYRERYNFLGWYTAEDGGTKVTATTKVTADITYYAHWEYDGSALVAVVAAEGCETMGKVTGGNATFKAGAKVTLKATANKGFVFVGWRDTAILSNRPYLSQAASFTYVATGEPVSIEAMFASLEDDAASLHVDVLDVETEADGTIGPEGVWNLGECVTSLSLPKLTVKGLPAGIKYDAKTMRISGKATKPGVYEVTVSATNATVKKPVTATFEIVVPNLKSDALPNLMPETDAYGTISCGVAFDPGLVDCSPEDGWTVKAAGLPAGLKYDAKTGKITGVPTKAGTFTVTFTATRGKEKETATITLTTEALPDWAAGTFTGYVKENGDSTVFGPATMTVAASGKISGKFTMEGTNWTFSAASYAAVDGEGFLVDAVAKAGKATMPVEMRLYGSSSPDTDGKPLVNGGAEGGFGGSDDAYIYLWRNMWKDKATSAEAKAVLAGWEGVYTLSMEDGGYASLTVGKNGDVKVAGKLADGTALSATSPFMYQECKDFFAVFTLSPSAYKGGFVYLPVGFGTERGRLDDLGEDLVWSSRNPQATGAYGEGFERWTQFTGAYYDKTKKLSDYYEALRFATEAPELQYTFKETYLGDNNRKKTDSYIAEAYAVNTLGQPGLTATVNEKGALVVAKATKPVQDKVTKEWFYDGANDGALALSFTQATGIFKGSYTFWYDYVSAHDETTGKETLAHVSKKVSFEGILVQGEEPKMNGFYLWDATGFYDDPKTGKEKTYKYKESHPVVLEP